MRLIKKFVAIIVFLQFILSCTEEGKFETYHFYIKNNTNQVINIITYNNNVEIDNININSNQRGLNCSYEESFFSGYNPNFCDFDSIKIVFPNDKGYMCNISGSNNLCFENGATLFSINEKFIFNQENTYEFTITQEDYENANDLP